MNRFENYRELVDCLAKMEQYVDSHEELMENIGGDDERQKSKR